MLQHYSDTEYYCLVCGLSIDEPAWGIDNGLSTHDICPCCGVEFGYEDSTLEGIKRYRNSWIAKGAQWFDKKVRPIGWQIEDQISNVPAMYR
jgi:hypothetical protein